MKRCPDCLAPMPAQATFDRCENCQRLRSWEPAFAAAEETLARRAEEVAVAAILQELRDPAHVKADAKEGEAAFASLD